MQKNNLDETTNLLLNNEYSLNDNDEVDEGRFWSRKEIEQNADTNIFTPNFLHEYNRLLKKIK